MLKYIKLFRKYYLSPHPEDSPVRQSDFPMYVEPFDFRKYRQDIFAFQDRFAIEVAETIPYKGEQFEIFRIETRNPEAKKKLLIFATVHGNEFATALVIPRLLSDIVANKEFYAQWQIRIIAPVNPVGLKYQSRYNEDGYDINRDFKNFETVQSRLERSEFSVFDPNISIDLHEHPAEGCMIFCSPAVPKYLEQDVLNALKDNTVPLWRNHPLLRILGAKTGVVRSNPVLIGLMGIFGIHTLGRYLRGKGKPAITTETSWKENNMEKRIEPHMLVIKAVIKEFSLPL